MSQEKFNKTTPVICVTVRNGRFLILVGAEERNHAYEVDMILSLQQSSVNESVLDIVAVYDFIGYVSGPHHIPFEAIDVFHTIDPDFKLDLIRFANAKDLIDQEVKFKKQTQTDRDNLDEIESKVNEPSNEVDETPKNNTEAKIIQFNRGL